MDSRRLGAENSVQTMMFYYLSTLIGEVEDPKQYMATKMGKMIDLSEEQIQYVKINISNNNKMLDNLSSSIALLENIEKTEKLDLESIGIVKNILKIMEEQCKKTLDDYTDVTESNEDNVE